MPISADTSYEISDLGRLRHTYKNGKSIILQPKNNGGKSKYLFYVINGQKYYAHHLVMYYFVGARPSIEFEIDHIDRDPTNNQKSNLRFLHYTENRLRGNDHPNAKLTAEKVVIIRQMANLTGYTQKQIGNFFGVSNQTISKITRGQRWSHV